MTAKVSQPVSYYDTEFPDENFGRKVREELKETDENRRKCLEILKKKLLDKEDLNPCIDDDFLLGFIRVSKFDSRKAYQRILVYYEERRNAPEIFQDYLPSTIKCAESARHLYASPYRSPDLRCIMMLKRIDYDSSKCPYPLILRTFAMIGDLELRHPLNQMCGFKIVLDLKSMSWSNNLNEYTPSNLKTLLHLAQKVFPARICAVHIINAPAIFYLLQCIIHPFLSPKIKNRVFIHKNLESLRKQIDPKLLPEKYGGCLKESELVNLFQRLYDNEDFFRNIAKYGYVKKK